MNPVSDQRSPPLPGGDFFGHPRALWMLFASEFWERFSYYGMRALLAVYVASTFFSHLPAGEANAQASLTYGAYTALIYATGIFGGFIADRYLGYQRSILLGGALMAVGMFLLLIPQLPGFLVGLAVIVVGNGLFKPNISAMVGKLYSVDDPRRDSGFTIFYMGINAGAFFAPIICGAIIGNYFGYQWGFFAAAIGMIFGLTMFHLLAHWLGPVGKTPAGGESVTRVFKVLGGALLAVPLVYLLLSRATVVGYLLVGLMIGLSIWFIVSGIRSGDKVQMHRYIAMLLLFLAKIVFWGMFEQAGSSLNFFARDYVDAPFDFTLFQSANPIFIVLLGPLFAWLWPRLDRVNFNPSIPRKFAIALLLVALGFTVLVYAIGNLQDATGKVPWSMLALCYLINTMGELCLSPIGLSMVTKLAAPRDVGMAMGAWFMCTALGNFTAGWIASVASSGGSGLTTGIDHYAAIYTQMIWGGVICGAVLLVLSPLVNKLMHGVK